MEQENVELGDGAVVDTSNETQLNETAPSDAPQPKRRPVPPILVGCIVVALILVAAGAFLVFRGGGSLTGTSYADADAVSAALTQAGLPCGNYATQTPSGFDINSVATEATCKLGGENLTIDTFKDASAESNWIGFGQSFGCALGKAFGISSFALVQGNGWTISGGTETEANVIARQFGGTVKVFKC